jgi:hypothetical protein
MGEGVASTPRKVSARVYRRRRIAAAVARFLARPPSGATGHAHHRPGPARLQGVQRRQHAPASGTVLTYVTGSATAAGTVAQVVKAGRGVARRPRAGHYRALLILVLGNDFKGVARVKKPTTPTRPPKPTAATRALPSWDPRPC